MKAVILAAGMGTRLKLATPKALVEVSDGFTILDVQLRALQKVVPLHEVHVVVGYRWQDIAKRYPTLKFVVNPRFAETNTSKSLLLGLEQTYGEDTLWLNGDVYLDPEVVQRVAAFEGNCVAVNNARVAEEEVKYRLDSKGTISEISKQVQRGLGEAVGVNKITRADLPYLLEQLKECDNVDYFERGIERSLDQMRWHPVDISGLPCIEIDFPSDLEQARVMAETRIKGTVSGLN